jgi:hypothetical protein
MDPLFKMMLALISIITMFVANILILTARNKLSGSWKVLVSILAFVMLIVSLFLIIIVVFSF